MALGQCLANQGKHEQAISYYASPTPSLASYAALLNAQSQYEIQKYKDALQTIKDADLILYMENGNILEKGNHEQLIKNHGAYFALNSQSELNV